MTTGTQSLSLDAALIAVAFQLARRRFLDDPAPRRREGRWLRPSFSNDFAGHVPLPRRSGAVKKEDP